jgi:hypothetical protein
VVIKARDGGTLVVISVQTMWLPQLDTFTLIVRVVLKMPQFFELSPVANENAFFHPSYLQTLMILEASRVVNL